ncbi:MAG TPA: 2-hydroxyacyl-CoA dehydratase [Candidatus Cloacimonadota bacterium]|nr:2-hydroxyacyl-CoA dehydratase [Candidatus Cloacimonadota bacterium]HOQ80193.1 2-hydroxyacyl-CoA dehydratase [Candidatus Cloacimonadota bacterium]HPK41096.1 2-hydroxyacyl-CoA dehydratase [Candidatus Cloacimonadota bacterium]
MKVGFTTSFPMEVVIGAGHQAIDLNNIFVLNNSQELVAQAEQKGFPRNICSWIKGMYSTISTFSIDEVIGIVQGDCSNTHSLMAILKEQGTQVTPFSYPYYREYEMLNFEIERLEHHFKTDRAKTNRVKEQCDQVRKKLIELDRLSWQEGLVKGIENHLWLVCSSDFNGNIKEYEKELDSFISDAKKRKLPKAKLRLGFVGVPPIIHDLYDFLEEKGARIIFNEVQRQFSMFYLEEDIVNQYLRFTYPYTLEKRIEDINQEIERRQLDGIISYTQSFCHRQLDHLLLKKHLKCPILQLEGDQPGSLDERSKIRLESFLEMF